MKININKRETIQICIAATVLLILSVLLFSNSNKLSFKQINDFIDKGNSAFEEAKYDDAKIRYAGALNIDSTSTGALFNSANADYRNGKYEMADKIYKKAASSTYKTSISEEEKSLIPGIYHNKGNAGMKRLTPLDSILMTNEMLTKMEEAGQDVNQVKSQFYQSLQNNLKTVQGPIKDYKDALRNAPENDSTRFNLAMAQDYEKRVAEILQSMTPPSNGGQNNDKQDQKDEQKDDRQQQQEQKKEEEKQQQEQQDPNQMSKENAEQILKALEQEEKEKQKKRKVEQSDSRYQTDKDW